MNYNKAVIVGRLVRDPEAKKMSNGNYMVEFSVATNKSWVDKKGERHEDATYHNVASFGKLADSCTQYLKKGQEVMVEGSINNRTWDKEDGTKGYRSEILASMVQFGQRPKNAPGGAEDASTEHDTEKTKKMKAEASQPAKTTISKPLSDEIDYPQEDIRPEDIPF